jgi:hypothetical protein
VDGPDAEEDLRPLDGPALAGEDLGDHRREGPGDDGARQALGAEHHRGGDHGQRQQRRERPHVDGALQLAAVEASGDARDEGADDEGRQLDPRDGQPGGRGGPLAGAHRPPGPAHATPAEPFQRHSGDDEDRRAQQEEHAVGGEPHGPQRPEDGVERTGEVVAGEDGGHGDGEGERHHRQVHAPQPHGQAADQDAGWHGAAGTDEHHHQERQALVHVDPQDDPGADGGEGQRAQRQQPGPTEEHARGQRDQRLQHREGGRELPGGIGCEEPGGHHGGQEDRRQREPPDLGRVDEPGERRGAVSERHSRSPSVATTATPR